FDQLLAEKNLKKEDEEAIALVRLQHAHFAIRYGVANCDGQAALIMWLFLLEALNNNLTNPVEFCAVDNRHCIAVIGRDSLIKKTSGFAIDTSTPKNAN